ncbi:MAG TPA: class II aldolase/adducin family protein [Gemmatimonadaceae bacterium]|nr:class II aldolase/adducin family protein [Gemmatimonadaceae bacterium]
MPGEREARRALADVCRRLYERGLIAGLEGNASVRLKNGNVLVTPAGVAKGDAHPDAMVVVDPSGRPAGGGRPSSELAVHLELYAARDDVGAVVHAHPPAATAFAVAGVPIPDDVVPEGIVVLGPVALVPFAAPGTGALAERLAPFAAHHDTFLLDHHGAVTVGDTLASAYCRMESLEHTARILLAARLLGPVRPLPPREVAGLRAQRQASGPRSATQPRATARRRRRKE